MRNIIIVSVALVLSTLLSNPLKAQTALGFSGQYGMEVEEFQGRVEALIPFRPSTGFSFVPNFEYYFMDEPSLFSINADFHYAVGGRYTETFKPYLGMGVAVTHRDRENRDGNTEVGLNLIGGANIMAAGAIPFFQVEYRAGDFDDLSIGGGVRFPLR